ncbi:hypothetical protein E2320_018697 [Naja naja]|nr:hypothetical protein E2320_018697 [Naja naja]
MEKSGEEGMPDLAQVMRILSAENIPNLPPGGGLAGKRNIIEAVYNRLNPHRENEGDHGKAAEGATQGKLTEALRQVRVTHRGNYRHLLEDVLINYRLAKVQGEECSTESATTSTSDGLNNQETNSEAKCEHQLAETQSPNEDSEMSDE